MKGAGPSPRQSPRALRPDPGPAMSFFRRKGTAEGRGRRTGGLGRRWAVGPLAFCGAARPRASAQTPVRAALCSRAAGGEGGLLARGHWESARWSGIVCGNADKLMTVRVRIARRVLVRPGVYVHCGSRKRRFLWYLVAEVSDFPEYCELFA